MEEQFGKTFRVKVVTAEDEQEPPVIATFPQGMPPMASLEAGNTRIGRRRGRKEMEDGSDGGSDASDSESDSEEVLGKTMGMGATRAKASARGSKKRRIVKLHAENQVLVYRGDAQMGIGERRSRCTYAVAVVDPKTRTVTVHPTPHLVTLKQSVKGRIDRAGQQSVDAQVAAAAMQAEGRSATVAAQQERNRLLTEAFGSAKNQKQLRSKAASRVDHTQVAGASAVLSQVKHDSKASDPLEQARRRAAKQGRDPTKVLSVEEDQAMGLRRRVYPKFNAEAETPAEAFPLEGLLTADEQAALGEYAGRLGKALQAEGKKAAGGGAAGAGAPEEQGVAALAHAVGMHKYVRDYLQELAGLNPDRKTRREQSKMLAFLDVALRIRSAGSMLVGRVQRPQQQEKEGEEGEGDAKPEGKEEQEEAEAAAASSSSSSSSSSAASSASSSSASSAASSDSGKPKAGEKKEEEEEEDPVTDAGDPRAIKQLRLLPKAAGAAMLRKFTRKNSDKSSRFKVCWERNREAQARLDAHLLVGWLYLYQFAIPVGVLPSIADALGFTASVMRARFAHVGAREAQGEKAGVKTKCIVLKTPLVFPAARSKKSKAR